MTLIRYTYDTSILAYTGSMQTVDALILLLFNSALSYDISIPPIVDNKKHMSIP